MPDGETVLLRGGARLIGLAVDARARRGPTFCDCSRDHPNAPAGEHGCGAGFSTHCCWRLALTILLGGELVLLAVALWMTLTIEGGRKQTSLNLAEIVERHNSVEMYQADQAKYAYDRLDRSKGLALAGACLCLLGLLATLWM